MVIEQAKGVHPQRLELGTDAAFDRLRRFARTHNLRLSEVARQTVEGELDPDTLSPTQPAADSHTS